MTMRFAGVALAAAMACGGFMGAGSRAKAAAIEYKAAVNFLGLYYVDQPGVPEYSGGINQTFSFDIGTDPNSFTVIENGNRLSAQGSQLNFDQLGTPFSALIFFTHPIRAGSDVGYGYGTYFDLAVDGNTYQTLAQYSSVTLTIGAVPLPASLPLFAVAVFSLGGLAYVRREIKRITLAL